jgi:hypothetical protein
MTLPLWLDLPGIRVVHACWHQPFMDWLKPHLTVFSQLRPEILEPATRKPVNEVEMNDAKPSLSKALEALTKGIEIRLPEGHSFLGRDSIERKRLRDALARRRGRGILRGGHG